MDCDGCGVAECDLLDEVDPGEVFHRMRDGRTLCDGCKQATARGLRLLADW